MPAVEEAGAGVNWSAPFADPIPAGSKPLATLQDAANYILKLKHPDDLWQKAGECLMIAARNDGHVVLVQIARIAFMKALVREEIVRERAVTWRDKRKARR